MKVANSKFHQNPIDKSDPSKPNLSGTEMQGLENEELMGSRLSFTDVELKNFEKLKKWAPFESSPYEQSILCRCRSLYYYKFRSYIVHFFHAYIPWTTITVGEVIFFLLFLLLAAGGGYMYKKVKNSGVLACIFLGFAYAFPTRNSIFTFLIGVPFERMLIWHKYVSVLSVGIGIYHGVISKKADLTGIILTVLMGLLVITSLPPIRRKKFEFFYKIHWILFLLSFIFAFLHKASLALFGAGIWLLDLLIRILIVKLNSKKAQNVELTRYPAGLMKICFENNNFKYKAGQYVFICVPQISFWEWHPFSLSSSPNEKVVSLHARVLGDWTKKLYEINEKEITKIINIYIEGPYGNSSIDIDSNEFQIFLLISGGIGITPLQSVCNQLIYEHLRGRSLKKIFFIWSVKDKYLLTTATDSPTLFYTRKLPNKIPIAFQPDNLIKHEHEHVLESFFHLTRAKELNDDELGNIDYRNKKLVRLGRPNLNEYFEKIKNIALEQKESRIAVMCCGPQLMIDECEKMVKKHSKGGVTFKFHHETFDF